MSRIRWLLIAALVLGALPGACTVSAGPDAGGRVVDRPPPVAADELDAFVAVANQARRNEGCGPLAWHAGVAAVAQAHSEDMLTRDYFDHTDSRGLSPMQRVQAAAIPVRAVAENIAHGQTTGAAVLQSWLDSPGHRRNLLNCEYTHHGVGLAGTYWTHLLVRLQ
jgi:uncharacterized protein YkwD